MKYFSNQLVHQLKKRYLFKFNFGLVSTTTTIKKRWKNEGVIALNAQHSQRSLDLH